MQSTIEHTIIHREGIGSHAFDFVQEKVEKSLNSIVSVCDYVSAFFYGEKFYYEVNKTYNSIRYSDVKKSYLDRKERELSTTFFREGDNFRSGFQERIKMKRDPDYKPKWVPTFKT